MKKIIKIARWALAVMLSIFAIGTLTNPNLFSVGAFILSVISILFITPPTLLIIKKYQNISNTHLVLTILALMIFSILLVGQSTRDFDKEARIQQQAQQRAEEEKQQQDEQCNKDLECLGNKKIFTAAIRCAPHIEKLANYSHKWTDGFLEPKFSRFKWQNPQYTAITLIGDKIQLQNGYGAWQNHIYECDLTLDNFVLNVRVSPGKI